MYYEALPIYTATMKLVVYIETIVRGFEKYHKYTIGLQLRERSQRLLFMIAKANMSTQKHQILHELRNTCEEFKMTIQIAKELHAFRSFKQFEHSARLAVDVCKQSQAWLRATAGV